jgi:hypothetical protein
VSTLPAVWGARPAEVAARTPADALVPVPRADDLRVGQRLLVLFVIDSFAAGEHLTLRLRRPGRGVLGEFAMTYAVHPDGPGRARLTCTVVVGGTPGPLGRAVRRALAWGDLIMMRRQLRTLTDLAVTTT